MAFGVWLRTSGTKASPSPIPKETAIIKISRRPNRPIEAIIFTPAAATVPNITIVAPPKTGAGRERKNPPIAGNKPSIIRKAARYMPTYRLATPVI